VTYVKCSRKFEEIFSRDCFPHCLHESEKDFSDATHRSVTEIISLQIRIFPHTRTLKATCLFRLSVPLTLLKCTAETRIRKKMEGDTPAAVSLQLPFTENCSESLSSITGCCITGGQKGSEGARCAKDPLLGVFPGWKRVGKCKASARLGSS